MHLDISKFKACNILVVGDLMIDEYVWGEVERISPEAPVQVVSVTNEGYTLGGSGNVVSNLIALGAKVAAVGITGTGHDGQLVLELLIGLGADTSGVIQEADRTTTRKTRIIAASQQVLRIDRESKKEICGQKLENLISVIEARIPHVDAVLISDYGKGLICPVLLAKLTAAAKTHRKIVVADPKGYDFTKYNGVTLLTPNKKEAALAAAMEIKDISDLMRAGAAILEKVDTEKLLITCGRDGMVLFGRNQPPYKIEAQARQVYDVSGAGDTVLAVMGLAAAAGASFEAAAVIANAAAGVVVGKVGTATVSERELQAALAPCLEYNAAKHIDLADLRALIAELRRQGKQIVLTNGCFDLLHAGHIRLFAAAKNMGQVLIVAIDNDESVRRLKGPGRPVITTSERIRILCALESVDYVLVFSSEQLAELIQAVRPDVLVKGSNYRRQDVLGRELVEGYGGQVALIPVFEEMSTSRIIDAIRNGGSKEG